LGGLPFISGDPLISTMKGILLAHIPLAPLNGEATEAKQSLAKYFDALPKRCILKQSREKSQQKSDHLRVKTYMAAASATVFWQVYSLLKRTLEKIFVIPNS